MQPDGGGGNFGTSVAGTQNTAFVGAPGPSLGTSNAGAAYLFDADPTSPTFGQTIAAVQEPTPTTGDDFGSAVGLDYGALIVGASTSAGTGAAAADLYQPGALASASSVTTYANAAAGSTDSVIVSGTFTDLNPSVALSATINWGDGSGNTVLNLPVGSYAFSAPHVYATDLSSRYNVGVTLDDGAGRSAFAQTTVYISDPAPAFAPPGLLLSSSSIAQNGSVAVSGTIQSPGSIHTNTVVINWGDGSAPSTLPLPLFQNAFSAQHTYTSSPPGTTSGSYVISADVTNEEFKSGHAATSVTVSDVAPAFTAADLHLSEPAATGGDTITLSGRFTDLAQFGAHTVTINWGDGSAPVQLTQLLGQVVPSATPGLYTYTVTHQYLNNPVGSPASQTDAIAVTVSDDGGTASADKPIQVVNSTPSVVIQGAASTDPSMITLAAIVTDAGVAGVPRVSWTVTQGNSVIAMGTGATFSFPVPTSGGSVVASAAATDSDGGTGTALIPIAILTASASNVADHRDRDLGRRKPGREHSVRGRRRLPGGDRRLKRRRRRKL